MRVWGSMGCFSPGLVTRRSSGIALQGTWPSLRAPTISTASKVPVWGVRMWCGGVSQITLEDGTHRGAWAGTSSATSVYRTQIPREIRQVRPSPGLRSDPGIEGSERVSEALGSSDGERGLSVGGSSWRAQQAGWRLGKGKGLC